MDRLGEEVYRRKMVNAAFTSLWLGVVLEGLRDVVGSVSFLGLGRLYAAPILFVGLIEVYVASKLFHLKGLNWFSGEALRRLLKFKLLVYLTLILPVFLGFSQMLASRLASASLLVSAGFLGLIAYTLLSKAKVKVDRFKLGAFLGLFSSVLLGLGGFLFVEATVYLAHLGVISVGLTVLTSASIVGFYVDPEVSVKLKSAAGYLAAMIFSVGLIAGGIATSWYSSIEYIPVGGASALAGGLGVAAGFLGVVPGILLSVAILLSVVEALP